MKLTGELKTKVESAAGMEEKKVILADAGIELTDEELAAVAGGTLDIGGFQEVTSPSAPVFRSSDAPQNIRYLHKGTKVMFINGSETVGGPDMTSYSPLIKIITPIEGYIPVSALNHGGQ